MVPLRDQNVIWNIHYRDGPDSHGVRDKMLREEGASSIKPLTGAGSVDISMLSPLLMCTVEAGKEEATVGRQGPLLQFCFHIWKSRCPSNCHLTSHPTLRGLQRQPSVGSHSIVGLHFGLGSAEFFCLHMGLAEICSVQLGSQASCAARANKASVV